MKISLIAAISEDYVLGRDNTLPWHLPDDLKRFKAITSGHTVIMGRKTFESIGSRPLPKRRNIVLSRTPLTLPEGAEWFAGIADALESCKHEDETFIVGGGEIYRQTIDIAHKIYLTKVHTQMEGDTWFPIPGPEWKRISKEEHPADDRHLFPFTFEDFERK